MSKNIEFWRRFMIIPHKLNRWPPAVGTLANSEPLKIRNLTLAYLWIASKVA
jgi:hypothetical protein